MVAMRFVWGNLLRSGSWKIIDPVVEEVKTEFQILRWIGKRDEHPRTVNWWLWKSKEAF